jgi:hypothetical protein
LISTVSAASLSCDPPRPVVVVELHLCDYLGKARRQRVDVAQAVDLARLAGVDGLDQLVTLRQRSAGGAVTTCPPQDVELSPKTRLTTRVHPCRAQHDSDVWVHSRLRTAM